MLRIVAFYRDCRERGLCVGARCAMLVAVYRKSGLGGRAALSGFFLEHLTLPETEHDA